jgi:hypothetical protein
MIVEAIMHRMGWADIWYAHPGNFGMRHFRRRYIWPGRWGVGVWTGPQNDLLCIKRCDTNEEAERCLSPLAPTALAACLFALGKCTRLGIERSPIVRLDESAA